MAGAPVYDLARNFYAYKSDNGTTYNIGTTVGNANAQTTPATPVAATANPAYPRGWVERKVHGAYLDTTANVVYRSAIPILDPTDGKWTGSSTTFTKGGQVFVIEGRIGERRTSKGG